LPNILSVLGHLEFSVSLKTFGGNVMYSCMKMEKMRPVETILRMGEEGIKENDGVGE
jgi:hypothetical protein